MPEVRLYASEADSTRLPPVCMRCGAPATTYDVKKFSWHPPWVYLLILGGLLPLIIVSLIVTKRMTVRGPFCDTHRNHWTWRSWLSGLSLLALVVFGVGAIALMISEALPKNVTALACVGTVLLGVAWMVLAIVLQSSSVGVSEITDRHITLKGVAFAFGEALRRERSATAYGYGYQEDDFRLPRRSSSGVPVVLIVFGIAIVLIVALAAIATVGENPSSQFPKMVGTPFIDNENHFRLKSPGGRWTLLTRQEVRANNPQAVGGAKRGTDDIYCSVLVEDAPLDFRVAGREKEVAEELMAGANLKDLRSESITPLTFKGIKAVRYRFTASTDDGRVRVVNTVFVYGGKIYQLFCAGALHEVLADGSAFQPFWDAFELLPADNPLKGREEE